MLLARDLTPADCQVMQDYLDKLAETCETERFIIWNHPVYDVQSQPTIEET